MSKKTEELYNTMERVQASVCILCEKSFKSLKIHRLHACKIIRKLAILITLAGNFIVEKF